MESIKKYNSLDLGKFIAALLVVAIHANPFSGIVETIIIGGFARLAVPFFFIVSSFLFFLRNPDSKALLHFLKRLLLLYLFWGIFAIPLFYVYHTPPYGSPITISQFVYRFFNSSTYPGSWFLMALMQSASIIWLLSLRLNNFFLLIISGVCYAFAITPHSYYGSDNNEIIIAFHNVQGVWMSNLIYITLGKMVANLKHESSKLHKIYIDILIVVVLLIKILVDIIIKDSYLLNFIDNLLLVPSVLLLLLFLLVHESFYDLPYKTLREMSTVFYLSHFTFVAIVAFSLHHIIGIDAPLLRYFLVLCCCVTLYFILDSFRKLKSFGWIKYMI